MRDILIAGEVPDKKVYSITEEISKSGYFWTVLHYASHYGHYDVLSFLIEFLDEHPEKFEKPEFKIKRVGSQNEKLFIGKC